MRLRQSEGKLDANIDLSDENLVFEDIIPFHIDMFKLVFSHSINTGEITGNITSGNAVIAWTTKDGKIHTSNDDNHFLESEADK